MRSRCACLWQSTCVCISAGVLHCRDLLYTAGTCQGGAVQRRSPVCVGGSARPCRLDDLLYAEQPEGVALLGCQPGVRDGLIPVLICHLCQHYLLPRQHILQIPQTLEVQIRIHPCRVMQRPSDSKQWSLALPKSASCQIMACSATLQTHCAGQPSCSSLRHTGKRCAQGSAKWRAASTIVMWCTSWVS